VDPRAAAPPGRRDLDQSARTGAQADERRGIAVAQDRARAGGENGGHPAALHRQAAMAYGVHARVHDVQPPALYASIDRAPAESQLRQLRARNHAVLALGQPRDPLVGTRGRSVIYMSAD
jgi:hypothetical protein